MTGDPANFTYSFLSGNGQQSVPWNSVVAFENIADPSKRHQVR